ncbi:MAG: hypothetical protein QXX68_01325 [Candidatus Pacearchaeota archaeon]
MGLFSSLFGKKEEIAPLQLPPLQSAQPQMQISPVQSDLPEKELSTTIRELEGTPDKAPFFVRIDKFNDARENLRMIAKRLKEMDRVLEKIQEVKVREDEELAAWKEEMKSIRENLAKIDEDVFNKL